jgi:sarcosine dehydrogenase
MPWPRRELVTARNLRLSALFTRLSDQGAVFGQKFGWERPNYFAHEGDKDHNDQHTFGKPDWLKRVRAEHLHTREAVSIFD